MLDKDPETRITAPELWDDPWISDGGKQALIKYDDNCIEFAEPTASEVDKALNSLRASTFIAMSVVAKLKGMVSVLSARVCLALLWAGSLTMYRDSHSAGEVSATAVRHLAQLGPKA